MKTSIEIADNIFTRIKQIAHRRRVSVRSLVEEALRRTFLDENSVHPKVQPKLLTFGGDGLTAEFENLGLNWDALRAEIYRGHGA